MKYSGVEWIGDIPDDWEIERLQWYISEIKESNNPMQTNKVLSLTNKAGVIPYEEKGAQGNVSKEDYTQYKLAYPDTIVANSMNILIGSVGICRYFGCVSPVYYVFKPNEKADLNFINYIFQTIPFQKELRRYANGIMEIRLRVSANGILKRKIAIPLLSQQQKIAEYLDYKCGQVDGLIANQQAQIEKLKQYKQSVITEAVTRGLTSAPLKDSGIDWIGSIPENWELTKIKYVCNLNPAYKTNFNSTDIVSYAPMDCVKNGYLVHKEAEYNTLTTGLTCFKENDIIMAKVTPCFENGNIAIATDLTNGFCYGSSELFVFNIKNINAKWLFYFLQNNIFKSYAISTMTGTGGLKRVSSAFVNNLTFAIPKEREQQQIANYLDNKCGEIDRLISLKQQKIEALLSYKKSLIYEYVTGKKEVV